jgi:hypothetical protein
VISKRPRVEIIALGALGALSIVMLGIRLIAAGRIGFGDSEALYAAYALHPQPAYLDHPGLIGVVTRAIGGGGAPSAARAHVVTSVAATLVPWWMAWACRACGATWSRALVGGLIFAVIPEMAVGLFGLTPDLLLAFSWIGALGLAAFALRQPPATPLSSVAFAATGLLAGVAAASKVSGLLLFLVLAATYASPAARRQGRTSAPWTGLAAGLLVIAPIISYETTLGWPMLRHRLVDTQHAAGLSLRNAAALLGGQLLYLSPGVALLGARAIRTLRVDRGDAVSSLLFWAFAIPASFLVPLCLWSRVAEPHWMTPALLALVPAATRATETERPSRVIAATAVAGAMVAAVYAWTLIPEATRLAPAGWDPKLDITTELCGWPAVLAAVEEEIPDARAAAGPEDVAVVAPHWVLCAQLAAGIVGRAHVGCNTPVPDDFDGWWPRDRWRAAGAIVWVTDTRFGPPPDLQGHVLLRSREIAIPRGGRIVRRFTVAIFTRNAIARSSLDQAGIACSPAAFRSALSSSASGFGVVRSLSPKKIELAPAYIASTWASRVSSERPALSRTRARGIKMRAHATMRTRSSGSTGGRCSSGVPGARTKALMGTLSGWGSRFASVRSISHLS